MANKEKWLKWLRNLLLSGNHSDCIVVCGTNEYRLHKSIICSQSTFFQRAFSVDMKEKRSGKIDLEDDNPEAVQSMIEFMYYANYDIPRLDKSDLDEATMPISRSGQLRIRIGCDGPAMLHHTRVYTLAHKYDIAYLRDLAMSKFKGSSNYPDYSCDLREAIAEAYLATQEDDRGMRDLVVGIIIQNQSLVNEPKIQHIMLTTRLGFDIAMAFSNAHTRYR